jgi:hypothetical protein
MYHKIVGTALPTTGLAAHFAAGLSFLYIGLITFVVIGGLFAVKRILPKRHTS